jgi:hypothetical protein
MPNEFWQMSPRQIRACSDGYSERQKRQVELADVLNHVLGKYISVAFNNPKKYPKEPILAKENAQPEFLTGKRREIAIKARILARKMRKDAKSGNRR